MKINCTLTFILLFLAFSTSAQDVTGIWRGYFAQNSFGMYEDKYKFEIQIEQSRSSGISGVTYSYKTTVFYGKATLQGIFTRSSKNLIINEIKLVELKIGDESQPCLMTCYLDYNKTGNVESLTGTYTSRNVKDKADCGSGKVYLEKTTKSDFYKEDFLVKRENQKRQNDLVKQDKPKKVEPFVPKNKAIVPGPSSNDVAKNNTGIKPGAEGNVLNKKDDLSKIQDALPGIIPPAKVDQQPKVIEKTLAKPDPIRKRSNELVKTLYITSKDIRVELYDNGEIDGDTITVYHNNQLVVSKKRLTDKPITFNVKADENDPRHEFVMVAENLGTIPPNTALMVITAGDKRYEVFLTSTEQKNAVVIVEYKGNDKP